MYQSLIWVGILGDDARRLRSASHAEDLERQPNALVDRMRRDAELGRDFLGTQVLADEPQTIELALAQPRNPGYNGILGRLGSCPIPVRPAARIFQANSHPAQHGAKLPEHRVSRQP